MIYRILCSNYSRRDLNVARSRAIIPHVRFMGAWMAGTRGFEELRAPAVTKERARFYFTEKGWREIGRIVAANARKEGRVVKVIRHKNPAASQVVYQDAYQVAILPRKKRAS